MKSLNVTATKIFLYLIKNLDGKTRHSQRFDNNNYWPKCNGGIMAVHVENIGYLKGYPYFSIAHYFKQNGDLVSDPEMTFINVNGDIYPVDFTQNSMGVFIEGIRLVDNELLFSKKVLADQVDFANRWMININDQQNICI